MVNLQLRVSARSAAPRCSALARAKVPFSRPCVRQQWPREPGYLEKCANERFPYRLQILRRDEPWITLRAQDRCPGAGKHIFCLREDEPPSADELFEKLERVDVVAFHEHGRRVSIVLDRKRYKRCDFLFLTKSYKGRPGESYVQIFWLTQRPIKQHRPAFKLVSRAEAAKYVVRVHSNERYPWRFPGMVTERGSIRAGDYALT